jgi:PAS domain S-box-containing protein
MRNDPETGKTLGNGRWMEETLQTLRVFVRVGPPLLLLFLSLIMLFAVVLREHLLSARIFEVPQLLLVMNTLFSATVFAVAAMALWGVLAGGSVDLLFLGCGTLALGAASFVGGLLGDQAVANAYRTIQNTGVLLAAVFQFIGVLALFVKRSGKSGEKKGKSLALFTYPAIIVFIAALTFAALRGYTPPFTLPGSGPTLLRETVLAAATFLFGVSAILLALFNNDRRNFFLSCYSVALGLTTIGLVAFIISRQANNPLSWLGRSAQFISGIYFLAAVVAAVRTAWANRWTVPDALADLLRPSEALYRDLAETASDAIILMHSGGEILLWNAAAEQMFGYNRTEAARLVPSDLVDPENAKMLSQDSMTASMVPAGRTREVRARRKGGDEFPAEISFSSRRSGRGLFTTLVIRDISERKRTEEALQKSEERYRTTVASIGDGVITTDEKGMVTYMNRVAEKLMGRSLEGATGRPLEQVFTIVNERTHKAAVNPGGQSVARGLYYGSCQSHLLDIQRRESDPDRRQRGADQRHRR